MLKNASKALTKNQMLVLEVLSEASSPMSAYTVLDELRDHGFRAPLQVYRAIEKLIELGLVHRLESLNAFVACSHPSCKKQETLVFMICDTCNNVDEITDKAVSTQLEQLASGNKFTARKSTIELHGSCTTCQ